MSGSQHVEYGKISPENTCDEFAEYLEERCSLGVGLSLAAINPLTGSLLMLMLIWYL